MAEEIYVWLIGWGDVFEYKWSHWTFKCGTGRQLSYWQLAQKEKSTKDWARQMPAITYFTFSLEKPVSSGLPDLSGSTSSVPSWCSLQGSLAPCLPKLSSSLSCYWVDLRKQTSMILFLPHPKALGASCCWQNTVKVLSWHSRLLTIESLLPLLAVFTTPYSWLPGEYHSALELLSQEPLFPSQLECSQLSDQQVGFPHLCVSKA